MKTLPGRTKKKWLVDFIDWYFRAWIDALAEDMGDTYQSGVTIILAFSSALMIVITVIVARLAGISLGALALTGLYIVFGLIFMLHERDWV
ncbi:MAG: hypothetical protein NTY66_04575 [Candidatus Vogelbacteria bacterium]|nr:hypothetical protein [Candidatus Vogelbacteria bacterium]